jgi:hypothetical protein
MNKTQAKVFTFLNWQFDEKSYELNLSYQLEKIGKVSERLKFPKFSKTMLQKKEVKQACDLIHLMCGVSYYKSEMADRIVFNNDKPSETMLDFMLKTWKHGLAELAYENDLNLASCLNGGDSFSKGAAGLEKMLTTFKSLVAIGGGKDSLVTIEELKQKKLDITLFYVGNSALIREVAEFTQLPIIQIKRKIDPKLIQYNKKGAINGHVPITAINSSIAILAALLFGFDSVVFSNEYSADSANTVNAEGELVNHQYSKSYAFEKDITVIIRNEINPELNYYSQQRGFSELAILKKFSQYPHYFPVFSSCNRNFHIEGSKNKGKLWCCDCPKCRFIFIGLAPFISQKQLLKIFNKNMLDDEQQKDGFSELLGITGFKPFECVGEIEESQLAFNLIEDKSEWQNSVLVKYFKDKCPSISDKQHKDIMQEKQL